MDLPGFSLTAVSAGTYRPFSREDMKGRVWVADFIFTRCGGPCPLLSNRMARLQADLPSAVGLLSFTVDPDYDSPSVLSEYAGRFGAQAGRWLFVTGKKELLYRLILEGFGLSVAEDPGASAGFRVTHSTKLVLIDREARVAGTYDSDNPADLRGLRKAAAAL